MTKPTGERSSPYKPTGYKMIESAEIKNFRCFSHAKLNDCKRINILVGSNGSGKTSLLEALFLAASGSVEVALRLRALRGYDAGLAGGVEEIEDVLWRDLFHKFKKNVTISVSLLGTEHRNRSLTIKFNDTRAVSQSPVKRDKNEDIVAPAPITFDWVGPKGRRVTAKPQIRDNKIQIPAVISLPEETYFFAANQNYSALETAKRFSELSKHFREQEVTERLQKHFADISQLSIELVASAPMVSAKVGDVPEKIPLNLISSGMTKVASMLFAIASKPGGVLLVDEIENGIYFRRLSTMWESMLDFCQSNDAQVFASTHSHECIAAASQLAREHPEMFSLIHTDSSGALRQFSGDRFAEAVAQEIEIR